MVLVKTGPFFRLFILGNIGQDIAFYNIVERGNTFLGYKNKKLKKSRNFDGFGQKMAIFPMFLF